MFDTDGFMSWLRNNFKGFDNSAIQGIVGNLANYAINTKCYVPDQVPSFISEILPDVEFGQVAVFCSDDMLTEYGQQQKNEAILSRGTCGKDLKWELNRAGVLTISGTGKMDHYHDTTAPWNYNAVKEVIISDGVTNIGDHAFDGLFFLSSVTIPESVTTIGAFAFGDCTRLESITLPDSVAAIGYGAFLGCIRLTSVSIPENMVCIRDYTFYGCASLTSVTIPESITAIGAYAFEKCSSLTSITIPDSVLRIGTGAFINCVNLASLLIPDSVVNIGDPATP